MVFTPPDGSVFNSTSTVILHADADSGEPVRYSVFSGGSIATLDTSNLTFSGSGMVQVVGNAVRKQ